MQCAFCELPEIRERWITENETAAAFPTNIPITPGHTLIVPKRCVANVAQLTDVEREDIFALLEVIKGSLRKGFGAQGFNIAWNEEKLAGQSVPHFHLHVVPRTEGDTGIYTYEPREFLYRPGERAASLEAELIAVAEEIRAAL